MAESHDLEQHAGIIPAPRRSSESLPVATPELVEAIASGAISELELGDEVGAPWTVRAGSSRYAILTRTFGISWRHTIYTVIDWRAARVGPCNLIGGQWRDGTYTDEDCQLMLASLAAGVISVNPTLSAPLLMLHPVRRES